MVEERIIAALAGALNGSPRARALAGLAYVKYPPRELALQHLSDGTIAVNIARYGYEYKHRGPKPPIYPISLEGVREALASVMPEGVTIQTILDFEKYISILFLVKEEH